MWVIYYIISLPKRKAPRLEGDDMVHHENWMIPVKKISNTRVSLNSYYGKLFITRSVYKKDDLGFWFHKQLLAMYGVDKSLKDISALTVLAPDIKVPAHYGLIGRYIKGFKYKGIVFSFDYRGTDALLTKAGVTTLNKDVVAIGVKGTTLVVMGYDNQVYLLDKEKTPLGNMFDFLGLDVSKAPMEYVSAKIYKKQIPIAVILSYYIGITAVLKLLKVKYTEIPTGSRTILTKQQYKIVFMDTTLVVTKDNGVGDMIIAGFNSVKLAIKRVPIKTLDNKQSFTALFTSMSLPILYVNELKLMATMFVDPITKQVLELFKYPTTLRGMMVKATEMLLDDNYEHPNNIDGALIKGYERVSGMMYLELVQALRTNANKSHFGKSKIAISPYAVIRRIGDDSTTVLIDDVNPIATLKQTEDVSYLGSGGRKEETMSEATRIMHSSEIGVISEAVKDSGAVGVSAYLSAAPNIKTTRGTVGKLKKADGWSTILSTAGMLAPFGTQDDPKRLNFVGIQAAHVIPMHNMEAPYVRTGYETVMATRSSENFVISAKEAGTVVSVSKSDITVLYKDAGKKKYVLKEWTTKEEAGTTYTHKLVANLKKGSKFKKDYTLAYDTAFYEPDIFDTNRVIYRSGASLTVALMETPETFEDSGAISSKISKYMSTTVTKVKSISLTNVDNIVNPLVVGAVVEPKDPLLSIADQTLSNLSNLDAKAIEILKNLKMLTPKAAYRGTISKIRVFYNSEFDELSPTLKKIVTISDSELKKDSGATGKVDGSYSVRGVPLLAGDVEIKYYIDVDLGMSTGDKAVLGNQLKFTVGEVYDNLVQAEDGTDIECLFSTQSIEARIVNSPGLIGTTSKLLEILGKKVTDEYFG